MSERTFARATHIEEIKLLQETTTSPLPNAPLVTFDLNLSKLQEFLNKVSIVVNKNSTSIQSLSEELSRRITISDGIELLDTLSSSIPSDLGGKKPKSNSWPDHLNAASTSLSALCERVNKLEKFKKTSSAELKQQKSEISSKLSSDKFEHEKKDLEEKILEKVSKDSFNKKVSYIEDLIKKAEENFFYKYAEIDKKISDFEVNTLWKIRDCESLLKTRVNEKFVYDALGALEGKIKKDLEILAASKISKQQNLFEILQRDMKRLEDEMSVKINEAKRSVGEIEKILPKKVDEEDYERLVELLKSKGPDRHSEIEHLTKKLTSLEEKLNGLLHKIPHGLPDDFSRLQSQFDHLKSELEKKVSTEAMLEILKDLQNRPQVPSISDLADLYKFKEKSISHFDSIEDKFEKLSKAMDLTVIKKALASKANEVQTKEEFLSVGQRLINLENGQAEIFEELERINAVLKKIMHMIEGLGSKSGMALISKKTFGTGCLSCGRGDAVYVPGIPHVQGVDGKFYKADINAYRPATSGTDWKHKEEDELVSRSPVSMNRSQKGNLSNIIGRDAVKSLSSTGVTSMKLFRPSSARK